MWIRTGRPSSPAATQSGSSRGSSTATRRPSGSRARRPSSFQTLSPRAPRAAESRNRAASVSPNAGSAAQPVVVEAGEDGDPVRVGDLPALDLQSTGPRPGRRRGRRASPRPTRRGSRSARPERASPIRHRTRSPRWLWASTTGNFGRRTSWTGTRSDDRGRKSARRRSSALIPGQG